MGFWDGFAGSLLGFAGSALGGATSAQSSIQGIEMMNKANAEEAQRNRDFQERMSNTAHTREVSDLRNAGLNPILSATGGNGASSPGGSMAVMQNTQEQAAPIKAQLANLAANTAKTLADAGLSRKQTELTETQKNKIEGGVSTPFFQTTAKALEKWLSGNEKTNPKRSEVSKNIRQRINQRGASGSW